ncbi:MAG: DUF3502 domain-containing protein [Faecalibacterium sp.]
MKKVTRRSFLKAAGLTAAASAITACSSSESTSTATTTTVVNDDGTTSTVEVPDQDSIIAYLFGESLNGDKVLDEFYAQTDGELNTTLNIFWNTSADHREKVPLMLGNLEELDLVFDAYWMNLNSMVSQGAYADISSYFYNADYPGLEKAFTGSFLEQVRNEDGGIYCIPFTQAAVAADCYFLRKDLREKYGMDPIASEEDLELYFQNVQADIDAGTLDMIAPMGVGGTRGFYGLESLEQTKRKLNVFGISATGYVGGDWDIAISDDNTTVLGAGTRGDDDSYFTEFPSGYQYNYLNDRIVNKLTKWANYTQADSQTESDPANNLFFPGKVACVEGGVTSWTTYEEAVKALGGELEMFLTDAVVRNQESLVPACLTAWNFLCLPSYSDKIERTMKFIDWIFQTRDNHDLFELGIEGDDWEAVGEEEYLSLDSANKYSFPGYELTWNPNYIRTDSALPDDPKEITMFLNEASNYQDTPLSGFIFDTEETTDLVNALSSVTAVESTWQATLMLGLDKDATAAQAHMDQFAAEVKTAGIDVIREAMIRQIQAFLDRKNA